MLTALLLLFSCLYPATSKKSNKPHLVIIMMDDFGWGDPGYHGFKDHLTPNMDRLARDYLQLNQYYTQPVCTPGRSALMTGKYPSHTGLQHETISVYQPRGTPLQDKFLSTRLKEFGYETHAVGKWHLGFYKWEYTPLARGFDTFHGFFTGHETYFTHQNRKGYDFRLNTRADNGTIINENLWGDKGIHCSKLYEERIDKVIRDRDTDKPLFIYFAMTNPHVPVEPPTDIKLKQRYTDAGLEYTAWKGLITNADDQIGSMMTSLEKYGILNDTVVMIVSDNGGYAGNNGNLRGMKRSLYEGGIKSPAIIVHPRLRGRGVVNELMHVTDIHVLFTRLGRCSFKKMCYMADLKNLDGIAVYKMVFNNKRSRRTGFLINVNQINREAAIREGNFKLRVTWKNGNKKRVRIKRSTLVEMSDLPFFEKERQVNELVELETKESMAEGKFISNKDLIALLNDSTRYQAQLYDLVNDQEEKRNLAKTEIKIKNWLIRKLQKEIEDVVEPSQCEDRKKEANPKNFGWAWMPWG